MKSIFFDINIILDIFLKRDPFYTSSAYMFSLVEKGEFQGFLGAASYPILFYLLRKEKGRDRAINILKKVRVVLSTISVTEKVVDSSLNSDIADFAHAIQYYSALEAQCDYFITRNKRDYPANLLKILTPDEFLALLQSENNGQEQS